MADEETVAIQIIMQDYRQHSNLIIELELGQKLRHTLGVNLDVLGSLGLNPREEDIEGCLILGIHDMALVDGIIIHEKQLIILANWRNLNGVFEQGIAVNAAISPDKIPLLLMPERVNLCHIVVRLGEFGEVPLEPARSHNVIVVLNKFEEFLNTILVQMSRQEGPHFF